MKNIVNIVLVLFLSTKLYSQQDPHYTQYMYNTMSVNPAYSGSRGHTVITALGRTQWVGLQGAPDTQTLSYDTILGYTMIGLGFNLVNDKIGPANETYLDGNVSYTILTGVEGNLAFGLKLGGRILNVDFDKGTYNHKKWNNKPVNINSKFLPTVGAGIYYYMPNWYVGLSTPNFLPSKHYNSGVNNVLIERMHLFMIAGYVFNLTDNVKFKPAGLLKIVKGSPTSLDVSANFLFNNRFRAGIAWRWDDSVSVLLGMKVTEKMFLGYAYDLTSSRYSVVHSGTHELTLQYEFLKNGGVKSPRFFF